MFSSLEIIAIIAIVICQFVIAYRAYNQIKKLNTFLPQGRNSLTLGEYEVPADQILNLEPSDVVGKITFRSKTITDDESDETNSSRKVYSVIDGDITIDENGNRIIDDNHEENLWQTTV